MEVSVLQEDEHFSQETKEKARGKGEALWSSFTELLHETTREHASPIVESGLLLPSTLQDKQGRILRENPSGVSFSMPQRQSRGAYGDSTFRVPAESLLQRDAGVFFWRSNVLNPGSPSAVRFVDLLIVPLCTPLVGHLNAFQIDVNGQHGPFLKKKSREDGRFEFLVELSGKAEPRLEVCVHACFEVPVSRDNLYTETPQLSVGDLPTHWHRNDGGSRVNTVIIVDSVYNNGGGGLVSLQDFADILRECAERVRDLPWLQEVIPKGFECLLQSVDSVLGSGLPETGSVRFQRNWGEIEHAAFIALYGVQEDKLRLEVVGLDRPANRGGGVLAFEFPESLPSPQILDCGEVPAASLGLVMRLAAEVRSMDDQKQHDSKESKRRGPHALAESLKAVVNSQIDLVKKAEEHLWSDKALMEGLHAEFQKGVHSRAKTLDALELPQKLTDWPLVCVALLLCVSDCDGPPEDFLLEVLLGIDLYLANFLVDTLTHPPSRSEICRVMCVLQSAARRASFLQSQHLLRKPSGEVVGEKMGELRGRLNKARERVAKEECGRVTLSNADLCREAALQRFDPLIPQSVLPPPLESELRELTTPSLEERKKTATNNMGSHYCPLESKFSDPPVFFPLPSLPAHPLGPLQKADNASYLLQLRAVDGSLFDMVQSLNRGGKDLLRQLCLHFTQPEMFLRHLDSVMKKYNELLESFIESPAARALPHAELRSREILATWAAWSVAHATVCQMTELGPGSATIGPPFSSEVLWRLSVGTKEAEDALKEIRAYVKRQSGNPPIFDLSDLKATIFLADEISAHHTHIQNLLAEERKRERRRRAAQWAEIQRKKAELESLREELRNAQKREQECHRKVSHLRSQSRSYNDSSLRIAKQDLSYAQNEVQNVERQVRSTNESFPRTIFHLLPKADADALRALFFLFLPQPLTVLARLSVAAQQALLPRPSSPHVPEEHFKKVRREIVVEGLRFDWKQHYNAHRGEWGQESPEVGEQVLELRSDTPAIPKHWGPKTIDEITQDTECEFYCVLKIEQ
uniref:Uncharacterized protein n=1 Tax=Chromera velia CCMP2878 TaxID=1169474 RepID=A0A0G4FUN3_9ALVE|eukprot:Cvel_18871.t1-p1 / transcript=Cvel_18871.t1 / gene=Cvel_18871 / organism=Chromera_velia_CCMP2878 / gene_product=hypothetical protein / transcript_product=hypothetical protein / location=Cvel_scaffold1589:3727-7223(+) / protein_length=1034 / sequence_SO=supercontig / SO=protein_coding / is_pseudo=false